MASPAHAAKLRERIAAEGLPTEVLSGRRRCARSAQFASAGRCRDGGHRRRRGPRALPGGARAGKKLLLANKGGAGRRRRSVHADGQGRWRHAAADRQRAFGHLPVLPEDPASWDERVDKIILTASGGPFRNRDPLTLAQVTPDEACAPELGHGRKISVDSATMMNKALEVIEARYLFGLPPERIEVVIHPQSVLHPMVQYRDRSKSSPSSARPTCGCRSPMA